MDTTTKIKRKQNPKEKSSFLSNFFFLFAFKTISKGFSNEFVEDDIYEIMKDYRSEKLGKRVKQLWTNELKKPSPSIVRCLVTMFGIQYMLIGLAFFTYETTTLIIQPVLTGKLVSYFVPNTEVTQNEAILYACGILACKLAFSLLDHTYFLILQQICLKVKICLSALVYRKCLKLNLHNMPEFASGMALTLITKDIMQFDQPLDCIHMFFNGTIQVVVMTTLMYRQVGVPALVGTSFLFILIPTQFFLGLKSSAYRIRTSSFTDLRVRVTQEILTAIRIIKMYTWELFFSKSVDGLRRKELKNLRILFFMKALASSIGQLSSRVAFYLCVMSYIALGNHITAEKAFFITGSFSAINVLFVYFIPNGIGQLAELNASFKRLRSFLLLDEISINNNVTKLNLKIPKILIKNIAMQSYKEVTFLKNINLEIVGGLTIVTGSTGSGKSAFLKSILGETNLVKGKVKISGNISYASQEPWLFPGSIKQNIIFGEEFDQERYEEVIQVCALNRDLINLPNGDQTSLTDKGLNLSRGQKTRINLSRAIYRKADIYLLDDCFSAVDALVTNHIFNECIQKFLKNKICVLVSNQDQLLKKADRIVVLGEGTVRYDGNYEEFKKWNDEFKFIRDDHDDNVIMDYISKMEEKPDLAKDDLECQTTDNIYSERKEDGSVNKKIFVKYFKQGGGLKMIILLLTISIISQAANSWADYFVSFWVDMEQELSAYRINKTTDSVAYISLEKEHDNIMLQYSFVILGAVVFTVLTALSFYVFASKASVNMHSLLLNSVLKAGMTFFDKNLSGNVLNRFSRDLGIIDEQMPFVLFRLTTGFLTLFGTLFVVTSVNIYFMLPSLFILIVLVVGQKLYLPTGRSIRRLEGSTRSPIVGHLNATLEGLTTIRASQSQKILKNEYDSHQNLYNSASYMYMSTSRAFAFYLDMLGVVYITVITFALLFIKSDSSAGEVGLAITQSFSVVYMLQSTVRNWVELEIQMTSTERVVEYIKTRPEDCSGNRPTNWPTSGKIVYNLVNLHYSTVSEPILKNVSFVIEPYQKVGIVGRTGAGKSSIISSLFKLYDFTGHIYIDNIDINSVETSYLRSKISIIPQDPVLFSGTVRTNLDPYRDYPDTELWNALEEVKMKDLVDNLDNTISESGSNFSIGQKQLFCLARALIRKNKILVLDEATANVDSNTDELIQNTIKKTFSNYTVITIAHRLSTILHCDKVVVMDLGKVIEFENPITLLNSKNGTFYKMAVEAGIA